MARIIGDNADNQLIGTLDADIIRGLDGSDRIVARGGDDIIRAGSDDDTVKGQRGDDNIRGNGGDDVIKANAGDDRASGGGGNDKVKGGRGSDILKGGAGDDILKGGADDDVLKGGGGDDLLIGDTGDDTIRGGAGNDRFIWNNGDGSDLINGGAGFDITQVNGADAAGDEFDLRQVDGQAIFNRLNLGLFTLTNKSMEQFEINGQGGDDSLTVGDLTGSAVQKVVFSGGDGDDVLDARESSTAIEALGGEGNDLLQGGSAEDSFVAGAGDDIVVGQRGDDTADLGAGDDRFIWNNGDGSDFINGGAGFDITQVNGADAAGDEFDLSQVNGQAIFNRLNLGLFTLTNEGVEQFEINGQGGDDSLVVSDMTGIDVLLVAFDGGDGDDSLDAANAGVAVEAFGRAGDDTLTGGSADDTLIGGAGIDVITGGLGSDRYVYGSDALGTTDRILDYATANDQYVLNGGELGIETLAFEQGFADDLQLDSNVVVLTQQSFANAGAAAAAIANGTTTAAEGVFIYFNENLGIGRLVHSQDLGGGGDINVLANMENITQVADLANFSNNNFALV